MRQDIIKLYDEYTHERLDRRVFMDQLAKLAGGTTAAAALVPAPAATCRATWRGAPMHRGRCLAWW